MIHHKDRSGLASSKEWLFYSYKDYRDINYDATIDTDEHLVATLSVTATHSQLIFMHSFFPPSCDKEWVTPFKYVFVYKLSYYVFFRYICIDRSIYLYIYTYM